jgi:hypothetical protein
MSKFTRIVMEQQGKCWFCGEDMGADCTREHLLARSLGGGNERSNLRAAHGECNSAAGHLSVEDKRRMRVVGHEEGRVEMLLFARQLRRADSRMAFTEKPDSKRGTLIRVVEESGLRKIYRIDRQGKMHITYQGAPRR